MENPSAELSWRAAAAGYNTQMQMEIKKVHKVNSTTLGHAKMHCSGFTSYFLFLTGLKIIVAEVNGVLGTVSQDQVAVGLAECSGARYHRPTTSIGSSWRTVARALQIAWCKCLTLACIACSHKRRKNYVERIIDTLLKKKCNRILEDSFTIAQLWLCPRLKNPWQAAEERVWRSWKRQY